LELGFTLKMETAARVVVNVGKPPAITRYYRPKRNHEPEFNLILQFTDVESSPYTDRSPLGGYHRGDAGRSTGSVE
jgi:hypothetical protein